MSGFDSARFRKCMALAIGGATEGERQAGQAAAARVAVSAGLSFEEAERLARSTMGPGDGDDFADDLAEALARSIAEAIAQAFRGIHEEIARQMAARDQERRAAARERRRQEKAAALTHEREMAEWPERAKAEQAERDRLWAEQRQRAREITETTAGDRP